MNNWLLYVKGLLLITYLLIISGCEDHMNDKDVLIKADLDFSALSKEKGMNFAFLQYVADNGILLRSNSLPIVGKENIAGLFKGDDSGLTLTWVPLGAELAKSGELGFTYGVYELTTTETVQKGTYVSIWKKDKDGNWKWVLDSGNDGIDD